MGDEAPVSLFRVAVRNPRVHKFFPVRLVSQTRIELQSMRLSVQEEIADASQIGGSFNSGDQQLANAKPSVRPAHRHAANFGRRAVIPQHNTCCPCRLTVSQRNKMKSFAIMLIALHIERNALFGDKDFFSDPKALLYVLRRICSPDCYHPGPGVRQRFG
jgi:hypothetical protein